MEGMGVMSSNPTSGTNESNSRTSIPYGAPRDIQRTVANTSLKVAQLVIAFFGVVTAIVYTALTYGIMKSTENALSEQTNVNRAAIYSQERMAWNELDSMMLEKARIFKKNKNKKVQGMMVGDIPNDDQRLYLMYKFFGLIEGEVMLRERFGLRDDSSRESTDATAREIMKSPISRKYWNLLKGHYPREMREYMNYILNHHSDDLSEGGFHLGAAVPSKGAADPTCCVAVAGRHQRLWDSSGYGNEVETPSL
jgi:hypothetical protein